MSPKSGEGKQLDNDELILWLHLLPIQMFCKFKKHKVNSTKRNVVIEKTRHVYILIKKTLSPATARNEKVLLPVEVST